VKKQTCRHTILHLIETKGPGGAEKVLIALADSMNQKRFRSVVCLRDTGWLYEKLLERGIKSFILKDTGLLFDVGYVGKLMRICKQEKVTLIHAHEFLMNFYGSLVGILSRIPVVTTVHGRYYYWEKARRRMAMRFSAKHSQMVTVSQELSGFLEEKVGIPVERLRTIYNGISVGIYSHKKDNISKMTLPGISSKTKIVGTVGNLYPVKGQIHLLRAIPLILQECPDVIFLFAGRGQLEETLKSEAVDLGIWDYVRFLGFVSDVPALLNILDVFTLPSLDECFPLSVLEAMAHAVPPVVTDVGGNREIIKEGETGYIVPPANPKALAGSIIRLLKDKELAKSMGEQAFEEVQKNFSLETMLSQYEGLYNSLISH
jgi:glycosyltransferase involved in cell wall biosynthesis